VSDGVYLSVVITTRNDDHGGNPLWRLQAFIDTFDAQCRQTGLDAEVIIVEWNPPPGRKRLRDILKFPHPSGCAYRFVEVPPDLHLTLAHADALPLFQMIAKNVGIRRARGEFILATNIDIIFSNELVDFIAGRRLEPGCLYRIDRHDVESNLPINESLDARMQFCSSHQLRVNGRWGTYTVHPDGRLRSEADDIVDGRKVVLKDGWHVSERNVHGRFRWAMPHATILLDPGAVAPAPNVLEFELEPNPFHPDDWFDLEIADGKGSILGRFHVASPAMYRLPLPIVPDQISLRVVASRLGGEPSLAMLESRGNLAYVVRSIRLQRLADLFAEAHAYPLAQWRRSGPAAVMQVAADAKSIDVALHSGGDPVKFGPLQAPSAGAFRFVLECEPQPDLEWGALADDGETWLPSKSGDVIASDRRAMTLTVSAEAGQVFWLMLSVPSRMGDRVVEFAIRRLTGSAADGAAVPEVAATDAESTFAPGDPESLLAGYEYPLEPWRPAADGARVQMSADGHGIGIEAPAGGYAAKYGPLLAASSGVYRFALECDDTARSLFLGALSGGGKTWLPTSVTDVVDGNRRIIILTVPADSGQVFWLTFTTATPADGRTVRFTIRRLRGSGAGDKRAEVMAAGSPFERPSETLTRTPGRLGSFSSRLVDRLSNRSEDGFQHAVEEARHAIVLSSPELRVLDDENKALRGSYRALEAKHVDLESRHASLVHKYHALDADRQELLRQFVEHSRVVRELGHVHAMFQRHPPPPLHLNGCGDFQLMARNDWIALRGYPEVHAFSMNLDGLFSTIAFFAGIQERVLESPYAIYHLEHESGSGWTPEGEDKLRRRLDATGVPWIDARVVSELAAYMALLGRPMIFNDSAWGFGDRVLPEVSVPDFESVKD
jgi:hypothetical protein